VYKRKNYTRGLKEKIAWKRKKGGSKRRLVALYLIRGTVGKRPIRKGPVRNGKSQMGKRKLEKGQSCLMTYLKKERLALLAVPFPDGKTGGGRRGWGKRNYTVERKGNLAPVGSNQPPRKNKATRGGAGT